MSDILSIHRNTCPKYNEKTIQLSCDGVSETKSTSVSIDVYSLNIKNCRTIYPHKLVRPLGGKQDMDHRRHLREVISDISDNELRIKAFVGDNYKRAFAKFTQCHSAWYACDYCYGKGVKIDLSDNVKARKKISDQISLVQEKIETCQGEPNSEENNRKLENLLSLKGELQKSFNALKRKSHILWPYSTMDSEHRSRQSVLDIVEKIERGEPLNTDERKGILGRSILLDIPHFNFIYDVPAEYLHSGCLGVIKRLIELTFSVGLNRPRNTTRKLSSPDLFNKLMLSTKVFKECSRRARKLDLAVFKGQEYRNIILLFFPLIIECIEPEAKEITLWLTLVYMIRATVIPTKEFESINLQVVRECCARFYQMYEELFGEINCMYNLHVLCSHLLEIRTHGPLTETSAFKFESFYGELRRSFVP